LAIWADVNELGAMGESFDINEKVDHPLNPLAKILTRSSNHERVPMSPTGENIPEDSVDSINQLVQ
jgi:hypothetical protein